MSSAIVHQAKPCAASLTGSSKPRSYANSCAFRNARVYPARHMLAVQQRQSFRSICRASKEDEIVEKMKQQASQGDIWDSEAAGVATKVLVVSAAVAAVIVLLKLATPVIDNTIRSFPSPEAVSQMQDLESELAPSSQ